jgi:hypothetical protein
MKIGFFGDSFCAEATNHHSLYYGYKTYMKRLAEHYNAKIVNVGHGGCSVWDTLLIQLNPLIERNEVPDICVFVWTTPGRIFNRKIRRLTVGSFKKKIRTLFDRPIWEAARQYYEHLYDHEKEQVEYVAALRYIDDVVLPKLPAGTRIVHLWTAGSVSGWSNEAIRPKNITYPHTWRHGVEIRPSLMGLSLYNADIEQMAMDHRCNHLDGDFKNETLFEWIKEAIDFGTPQDYSEFIDRLFDKSPEADPPAT